MHTYHKNTFFLPVQTCKPVNGFNRCVIQDFDRFTYEFAPLDLSNLITNFYGKKIDTEILPYFEESQLDSYMEFLEQHEYALWPDINIKDFFPQLNTEWLYPAIITNAICEFGKYDYETVKEYFHKLGCQNIQIVFNNFSSLAEIKDVLDIFKNSSILNIEIFINSQITFFQDISPFSNSYFNLRKICIYNSNREYSEIIVNNNLRLVYQETVNQYFDFSLVNVKPETLVSNINLFSESQKHHTYFNKKLYIGPKGEIKNALECPESFGYIQDIKETEELKSIISTPEFQKYWFVHKEITDVCKDCEFRHMCVDNRLPYQRSEDEWYHKTECNYNPYICKWQGEDGYRTLQECGIRSDETGFYIDHDKIAAINRELWGDDE